jgi:hypothetical protein
LIFRAVALDAGTHEIVFRYRPRPLLAGAWISLAAALIWCALCVAGLRRPLVRRTGGR